jgi:hypothetical protein
VDGGQRPTYHRSTIRTGMPAPTWRQFYQGVAPTKNTYAQVDEPIGMMEGALGVDVKLAALEANASQFYMNEAIGFLEGINQDLVSNIFYGNQAPARQVQRPRCRASTTTPPRVQGERHRRRRHRHRQLLDLAGRWSPRTVFGIFPKGSKAGLSARTLASST